MVTAAPLAGRMAGGASIGRTASVVPPAPMAARSSSPPAATLPSVVPPPPRAAAVASRTGAMWMRHALGPGLELHVVADADARTMERVIEILSRFRQ